MSLSSWFPSSWYPWKRASITNKARNVTSSSTSVSSASMPSSDLWDLVMDMDWERVVEHAREHPQDAAYSDGHYHESVLYLACQHNPPSYAIRAILQAYPEAALQVSRAHHDLPLHIAARYQLGADILEELLRDYPVTAVEQTRFGRTPLMALWEFRHKQRRPAAGNNDNDNDNDSGVDNQHDEEFWNKVMIMLRAVARFREDPKYHRQSPSSRTKEFRSPCHRRLDISQTGTDGNENNNISNNNCLVLHAAVSLGALSCPIEVLEHVLKLFPEQVSKRDRWGQLPLHVAIGPASWSGSTRRKYRPREQEFVAALLRAYPEAARQRLCDYDGETNGNTADARFLLMTALSNRHSWNGGIKDLFHAAPEVLLFQDPVTGLYPFQLAAIPSGDTTNDLDTIFELLRAQPQVMTLMETSGATSRMGAEGQRLNHDHIEHCENCGAFVSSRTLSMAAEIPLLGTATAALIGVVAGSLA